MELIELTGLELRRLWRGGCTWLLIATGLLIAIAFVQQPAALRRQGVSLDSSAWAGVTTVVATLIPVLWLFTMPLRPMRSARPWTASLAAVAAMTASVAAVVGSGALELLALRSLFTLNRNSTNSPLVSEAGAALAIVALALSTAGAAAAIQPSLRHKLAWVPLGVAALHIWAVGVPSEILALDRVGARPWWGCAFAIGTILIATTLFPPRSYAAGRTVRSNAVPRSCTPHPDAMDR